MYHWYLVHSEYKTYLDRALQGRIEAQGRAVYLLIVGIEAAIAFLVRGAAAGLRRTGRAVSIWHRRRKTVQALSRLDARMLRDVGISWGDIEWVAEALVHEPASTPQPAATPTAAPAAIPAVPRLRLDLDCPHMRFAA